MKKIYNSFAGLILLSFISSFSVLAQNQETMQLKDLHDDSVGVHTHLLFPAVGGKVISLQILKNHQLKEHTTPIPALLVCVTGKVVYEDQKGNTITLMPGNYVHIEPEVKHWVNGIEDSQLLLMK